jgi:hypothetical protein
LQVNDWDRIRTWMHCDKVQNNALHQAVIFHLVPDFCWDISPGRVGINDQFSSISCKVKSADLRKNIINIVLTCPLASSG